MRVNIQLEGRATAKLQEYSIGGMAIFVIELSLLSSRIRNA